MRHIIAFLVLAATALAGCATAREPYPAGLDARLAVFAKDLACCDDPASFSYTQLPLAGTVDVVVGRNSPAFDFQSGLSPFAAFRLPDTDEAFRVQVKSFFDPPGGGVFYPVMAMLDDTFIVTRLSNLANLRLDQELATPRGMSGLAVIIPFDPTLSRERYLIVFTPAALLGAAPTERRDGDLLTAPTLEWLHDSGGAIVPASPFGRLRVTIAPVSLPGPG